MKTIGSILITNIDGMDRISYTYSEIDKNGNLVSSQNKRTFICTDPEISKKIQDIKSFVSDRMDS